MKSARSFCVAAAAVLVGVMVVVRASLAPAIPLSGNSGRLEVLDKQGKSLGSCPLKHTEVTADIAGFIARVTVRQQFQNPFQHKIEAVYTFPLSQDAAVDRMTMTIGNRVIQGEIKERGEARQIYERAKAAGHVASLLDQERPNIFTQSVANIEPGEQIDITISYSETLDWKDGMFQFDFPMVVGPRYVPGQQAGPEGRGFAPPTNQVPDADRITPMPVRPETRAGHDVSITVSLDAGLPIRHLESKQHEIAVDYPSGDKSRAVVRLKQAAVIPNKDFVIEYQTATDRIEDTVLAHTDERGKFFTLVLQPPKRVRQADVVPRELVFVVDNSGSMSGFPTETAKQAMALCIDGLHPRDTFNLITFSGSVSFCFERPVPNTDQNRRKAQEYLASLRGSGGTEMMKAIHACLAGQDDPERVRVVCFMTDGYVGNDMAIIDAVRKNAGVARVFSFGIGRSVNRFLLDGMARAGRGEVHYILGPEQAAGAGERFYERIRMPVLTDIRLDFGNLAVEDVYPKGIPDLFSAKPVVVKGRYKKGGEGIITLRGKTGAGPFERKIPVRLPDEQAKDDVLASLWARAKVDHLMDQDMTGIQQNRPDPAVKEEILGLGLRYRLLTQFTSFVAVEYKRVTKEGKTETVAVPIEMPEGVSYEGVFGPLSEAAEPRPAASMSAPYPLSGASAYGARGMGGYGGGAAGKPKMQVRPARPPAENAPTPGMMDPAGSMRLDTKAGKKEAGDKEDSARQKAAAKLAPELRGLAEKLARLGTDGNLLVGKIQIKAGRVEVAVQLAEISEKVLAKLKALGFQPRPQPGRAGTSLVGTIPVAKLEALAQLDEVRRIEPAR